MLILLLLLPVQAEWVEIAQQHYQKPLRPGFLIPKNDQGSQPLNKHPSFEIPMGNYQLHDKQTEFPRPSNFHVSLEEPRRPSIRPDFERTTKRNRIYINNSLPTYNWNDEDVFNIRSVDTEQVKYKTSTVKAVISKVDLPEPKPTKIIKVQNAETNKNIVKVPKPVIVKSVKNSNIIDHKVPKISNAVIVKSAKPTKIPTSTPKSDDFHELKPLEIYNLTDLDYFPEEEFTTVANEKVSRPVTTEKSYIKKVTEESIKSPEEMFIEDDWPVNDDRFEYVVEIVPSSTNKRRLEIIRNTVKPKVMKVTSSNYEPPTSEPSTTSTTDNANKIENGPDFLNYDKNIIMNEATTTPVAKVTTESLEKIQKMATKGTTTTTTPKFDIETAVYKGDNKESKLFHLSANMNTVEKTQDEKKPNGHHLHPMTDPDKVMIEEIIKEDLTKDNSFERVPHNNVAKIKRVFPTKIVKVDKTGQEIEDSVPTKAEPTRFIENTKTRQEEHKHINKTEIPFEDNIKLNSNKRKHDTSTATIKEASNNISQSTHSQLKDDMEEVTISIEDDDNSESDIKESTNKQNFKPLPTITEKAPLATPVPDTINTKAYKLELGSYESYVTLGDKIPEFVTKDEKFKKTDDDFEPIDNNQWSETKFKNNNEISKVQHSEKEINEERESEFQGQDTKEEISSDSKSDTLETLIKVLKIVTETIKRNTKRNFDSKVRYLEDLRDNIMRNIEERIDSVFPDDAGRSRPARSPPQPRGTHVEFPSSESALMTISFLTFAVYLIKLVLQIIQAYKYKAMAMMPTVVAAVGRAHKHKDRQQNMNIE